MALLVVLLVTHVVSAVAGAVASYLYLRANPKEAAKVADVVSTGATLVGKIEQK